MQIGFMPERGTIDAVFILRRMQEENHAKGKKAAFVLWTKRKLLTEYRGKCWNGLRKKGTPEVLARSVMSLYEGVKKSVRVEYELLEEFGHTKDLCCHLFQWC